MGNVNTRLLKIIILPSNFDKWFDEFYFRFIFQPIEAFISFTVFDLKIHDRNAHELISYTECNRKI